MCAGLILVLLINFGIRRTFDPSWYFGNETLGHKMQLYLPVQDSFNTLFVGSSTIFYNLDPLYFDSLMPREWNIRSFNLGGGGSLPPETYRFVKELITRNPGKVKNIILELRDVGIFSENHRNTLRKRYWLTPAWYTFMLRAQWHSELPADLRIRTSLFTTESFLERSLNLGYFNDLYALDPMDDKVSGDRLQDIVRARRNGMLPVSAEREHERGALFYQDTSRLLLIANACKSELSLENPPRPNPIHMKALSGLIEECRKHGIHLVFLLHPKMEKVQVSETLALTRALPENHLINLSDPDSFPELYLAENSLNYNHFNRKGTRVLTEQAAKGFYKVHTAYLNTAVFTNR